jgi:hypothetical protein
MSDLGQWFADRFIDDIVANDAQLSPIYSYQSQPIVSLEKALESVRSLIDRLVDYIIKWPKNITIIQMTMV